MADEGSAQNAGKHDEAPEVRLLEFDKRFDLFGRDFVHYDYNTPLKLPGEYELLSSRIFRY